MKTTPTPTKNLISTDEAAQQLGVSRRSVYRMMSRGDLPAVRLGRLNRIRYSDLAKVIDSLPVR